jgi:hypothetical protein
MQIATRHFFTALVALVIPVFGWSVMAQQSPIDTKLAEKYFQEAGALCDQDHARLWGISLCGPMLFVDPATHALVANNADREGLLTRQGNVYVGNWPEGRPTANTANDWAGLKWTTIQWPLPINKYARARLMMHELFHRIQDQIGLPGSNPMNNHLDSLEGRILLQLEWLALREAVTHQGTERRKAMDDALVFRFRRRELFPQAAEEERALEMNEGLAEYTGVILSGRTVTEIPGYLAARLDSAPNRVTTFVRSFAYETGPAYGFLLDQIKPNWRTQLKKTDDLPIMLQTALRYKLPADLEVEARVRAHSYDGDFLRASETARDNRRQAAIKTYRAKLVDGPVLILPATSEINYSFDPNELQPLGDLGTVYPTLKVSDAWGTLTVTGGALMSHKENRPATIYVSAPADTTTAQLKGDGWQLELKAGWLVGSGDRKGDFVVRKVTH